MSSEILDGQGSALPLTILSEEEQLFRSSIHEFAEEQIRPLVSGMDREGRIDPGLRHEGRDCERGQREKQYGFFHSPGPP